MFSYGLLVTFGVLSFTSNTIEAAEFIKDEDAIQAALVEC